jgi:predicted anti-sigma-YlaC factor YlaD
MSVGLAATDARESVARVDGDAVDYPDAMTCKEFVELVTDYLEGSLDDRTRVRSEEHLALCDGCDRYLDQMRETLNMLGRIPEESLSEESRERLLAAFRDWKRIS